MRDERRRSGPARIAVLIAAGAAIAGCTSGVDGTGAPQSAPPAPPAACMLDTAALATATGLTWTADHTTASDTRCVYDPAPAPAAAVPTTAVPTTAVPTTAGDPTILPGPDFVAVDVSRFTGEPAAELDTLAAVCEPGSRAPAPDGDGFVCRFASGSVYSGVARNGRAITVSASAVPAGTTAARLVVAFSQQLVLLK